MSKDVAGAGESPESVRQHVADTFHRAAHWGSDHCTYDFCALRTWAGSYAAALADRLDQAERDKAAVERVRDRHRKVGGFCKHCVNPWPCPTTSALDGTEADQ